jgi:iron complex transport system substrate-binding protein
MVLRHARGFSARIFPGYTLMRVHQPWQGSRADFSYILASQGAALPGDLPAVPLVRVPVRKVVTLTTITLPRLEILGVPEALIGIGGGKYACNPGARARLASGDLREVGANPQVDVEAALALRPDLVFSFSMGNAFSAGNGKLEEAGLKVILDGSHMEETPLGRAEWIKFSAAFFGRGAAADSAFADIARRYDSLASLVRGTARRPTVFTQFPRGGVWHMPGGRSYVARYLADAGADYLWRADTTRGSLSLDLESVLAKAAGADFWLNAGEWKSLPEGLARDARYAYFKAFREGRVYNNDLITCGEGNDFYETGSARPDLVLADLISLFHPEILPGHRSRWFRKIGDKP